MSSAAPLASVRPSGLKATEWTVPVWPVSAVPIGAGRCGSAMLHRRTVPSSAPVASSRPSGLNTTERTASL